MSRVPATVVACFIACTSTPRASAPPELDGAARPDATADATADASNDVTATPHDAEPSDAPLPPCQDLKGVVTKIAKGVYCVTGDVIVPKGTLLDIPAGTELIVKGRFHFGRDPALPRYRR